jgi:hypothetical protein
MHCALTEKYHLYFGYILIFVNNSQLKTDLFVAPYLKFYGFKRYRPTGRITDFDSVDMGSNPITSSLKGYIIQW